MRAHEGATLLRRAIASHELPALSCKLTAPSRRCRARRSGGSIAPDSGRSALGMVDARQIRGVEVLDVNGVGDDVVAMVVGLAEAESCLDPAAGEPGREAAAVVVATVVVLGQGPLAVDGPAELASQITSVSSSSSALVQVLHERAEGWSTSWHWPRICLGLSSFLRSRCHRAGGGASIHRCRRGSKGRARGRCPSGNERPGCWWQKPAPPETGKNR